MKKRIFALLGIVSILVSMLTITAFAADDDSIVRNLEEDQGTVDPYTQEWMTATFSLPNGVSNLGAKVVNNFAVIPSDVALLNFIATGPCVDGSCPYKVDWNGFDEDGDYVMEGTYELHISASVDDSSDTDIAYVTVVHTENMLKDFEIDKDPVNFVNGEVLTITFEFNYFKTGEEFEFLILDESGVTVKDLGGGTKIGTDGDYWIWQIVWDGMDDDGVLVEDGNYKVNLMITNFEGTTSDIDTMDFEVKSSVPTFEIEYLTVDPTAFDPLFGETVTFEYKFSVQADDVTFYITDYDDDVLDSVSMGSVDSGLHIWDGEGASDWGGTYKGKVVAVFDGETYVKDVNVSVMGGDPVIEFPCGFNDVAEDHVYCDGISWAEGAGIFEGDPDGKFRPAKVINRAEVLAVVMRAFGLPFYDDDGTDLGWSDVILGEWYMGYLRSGKMHDLLHGDGDADTVRPGDGVKRIEFLKFVMQAALIDRTDFHMESCYNSPYTDVPAEQWFTGYVCRAKDDGLFDTYDNLFLPSNGTTRAEVAEALYRMFKEYEWGIFGPPV